MAKEYNPHYPRLVDSILENTNLTYQQALDADHRMWRIKQEAYKDTKEIEAGTSDKTFDQVQHEDVARMQDFFEDVYGEDTWDDRHELYAENE
jgi:hypothetical protein